MTTVSMSVTERRHFLISGRVQGVGFRAFTHQRGRAKGLSGGVRNLGDGRVEAFVWGTRDRLDEFATEIRQGPARSRVDDVVMTVRSSDPAGLNSASEFRILEDGEQPWF